MTIKAMRSERLTAALVRRLATEEKRYRVFDTDLKGFFIQVDITGSKVFRIRKSHAGKTYQLRVGDATIMTVEEGRARARELLRDIDLGIDPAANTEAPTFAEVTELATAGASYGQLSKNSRAYYDGYLARIVLPELGDTPITEVNRSVLKDLFERTFRESGKSAVHGVRSAIGKIFEYAIDAGMVEANPAKGMKRLAKPDVREQFLTAEEMREFWLALQRPRISVDVRDALRLCLLTVLRRAEIAEATWGEINFENSIWTVPTPRTKRKKEPYRVPLSAGAKGILLARWGRFATPPAPDQRIFDLRPDSLTQSMAKLTSKQPFGRQLSPHDFRRTLTTVMAAFSVPEEVLERVLNHTPSNRGAIRNYNHHNYLSQKREVFDRWDGYVSDVIDGKITCHPQEIIQ